MSTLSLQRSKKLLQEDGWKVWIVQNWNQWAHVRQDAFWMLDLIAIRADRPGVTGIQATGDDVGVHLDKILRGFDNKKGEHIQPPIYEWLKAGNPFFIWAWRKRGSAGKRKLWTLRQIEFVIKDGQVVAQEIQDTTELGAKS